MLLEISQNSQKNKKVFSCEFCEIFKNTFLTEHLWTTASVLSLSKYFPNVLMLNSSRTQQSKYV